MARPATARPMALAASDTAFYLGVLFSASGPTHRSDRCCVFEPQLLVLRTAPARRQAERRPQESRRVASGARPPGRRSQPSLARWQHTSRSAWRRSSRREDGVMALFLPWQPWLFAILCDHAWEILSGPRQRRSERRCATAFACGRPACAPSCMSASIAAARAARSAPGSIAPTWASLNRARVSALRSS